MCGGSSAAGCSTGIADETLVICGAGGSIVLTNSFCLVIFSVVSVTVIMFDTTVSLCSATDGGGGGGGGGLGAGCFFCHLNVLGCGCLGGSGLAI